MTLITCILNAKAVKEIIFNCQVEAEKKETAGEIKKGTADKLASLLHEINTHIIHAESVASKPSLAAEDINWVRSLARKLDYYDFNKIKSSKSLSSAVDILFVSTVP